MGILELLQTPPEGDLDEADLMAKRAARLAERQSQGDDSDPTKPSARELHPAGPGSKKLARSNRAATPANAKPVDERSTADPDLLARLAAMEDRLDRHSMAFGALCELVCEPLDISEADLARSVRRIAAEY